MDYGISPASQPGSAMAVCVCIVCKRTEWAELIPCSRNFPAYSSIYLTVSFTIERFIAVCHPIRGQALCTESRAKKVIAGLLKFHLLFLLFRFYYSNCSIAIISSPAICELHAANGLHRHLLCIIILYYIINALLTIPFSSMAVRSSLALACGSGHNPVLSVD